MNSSGNRGGEGERERDRPLSVGGRSFCSVNRYQSPVRRGSMAWGLRGGGKGRHVEARPGLCLKSRTSVIPWFLFIPRVPRLSSLLPVHLTGIPRRGARYLILEYLPTYLPTYLTLTITLYLPFFPNPEF